MKKTICTAIIFGSLIFFTSCAKDECVCNSSANITEADAKDNGATLDEVCNLAKQGDASCRIETI